LKKKEANRLEHHMFSIKCSNICGILHSFMKPYPSNFYAYLNIIRGLDGYVESTSL